MFGDLTNNPSSTNLTLGDTLIQADTRRIVAKIGNNLLHTTSTATAVANVHVYELPNRVKKLRAVTFTLGSDTRFLLKSPDRRHWDSLNTATPTAYVSDFPEWYYIIGRQILYWPTPATGSSTITYDYDETLIIPTVADYVTGSAVTVVNGSATIVGTSTVWSSAMVGRTLQIAKSDTFVNDGDGDFYEIKTVASTTQLDLVKTYAGHSFASGGASYLIGEVSPLPDGFHELPVYNSCKVYYAKVDQARSVHFRDLANSLESELLAANEPSDLVVVEETDILPDNQNLYPRNLG